MSAPVAAVPATDSPQFSVLEHLDELRTRLLVSLAAVAVGAAVSLPAAGRIVDWLKAPAGGALPSLAFFSPTEALTSYVMVAAAAGVLLALPVIVFQAWSFVRMGLSMREQRLGAAAILSGSALFLSGAAFAYWGILPAALPFLLSLGGPTLTPVISIGRYLSFVVTMILACGLAFELPLVILALSRLGLVTPAGLRRQWRAAVLGILILSAMLTPTTDAVTMVVLAGPLLALYLASVWIAGRIPHSTR